MFKFTNEKLAESFRDRATKTMVIILGDDGRFWVCTGREAKRLVAAIVVSDASAVRITPAFL